jgi:hypothetical protein
MESKGEIMESKIGIYKKIHAVMKKVEFVRKDGQLGFGNNKFSIVTHDKVVSLVREHFLDNNVIVVPNQVDKGMSVAGKTSKGNDKIRFEALYDVDFIDIEDGSKITIRSEAHAEDSSDKAANKALTYAVKNALLKVLMLQTGDDQTQEGVNKISDKQAKMLKDLIIATNSDEEKFLLTFGANSYDDFAQSNFAQAVDLLQVKMKKAK